jgi:ubiquinone/menaquinone biosynthesis C-methylase UbiE
MPIDFHDRKNVHSYSGRTADETWRQTMRSILDPVGKRVVDIGCGGGIYSTAWADLGAAHVIGVDFSAGMLEKAREECRGHTQITFVQADALCTGLEQGGADVVFARALIHHLEKLDPFFAEAHRLLAPGGVCIIQDRTMEDVRLEGSPDHLRGYFFEAFPRLLEIESSRRPSREHVIARMEQNGFVNLKTCSLWEVRRVYRGWTDLEADLLARTGRSILHELSDAECKELVSFMKKRLTGVEPIVERDRWSLWIGEKAGGILESGKKEL